MGKLPGRLKKTPLLTEEQKTTEAKFGRCPKGHKLPHRTNRGLCTPVYCVGSKPGKKDKKQKALVPVDPGFTDLAEVGSIIGNPLFTDPMFERKIQEAETRHNARVKFVQMPFSFANEKEQDAWIEAKKRALVPLALADVEYSLKLGDQQEREKARKEVLDMTGHGKKEADGSKSTPQIIIVGMNGQVADNPWIRKMELKEQKELPAEAQVVNAKD